MNNEKKQVTMDKQFMDQYTTSIRSNTPDGNIFKLVRDVQDDAFENHGVVVSNIAEFYWHLRSYRDKKRAS